MENAAFVAALVIEDEQDRQACLEAMEKYGERHWWESQDPREIAYEQLREPVTLVAGRAFAASLVALLGRTVLAPEIELSQSNLSSLLRESEEAWTHGTPRWERNALRARYLEIIAGALRDGSIGEMPLSIVQEQVEQLLP